MATNFSPCKGSYVLNQFPSNVMFGMNGYHISASGAIQGHHGPLVRFPRHGQNSFQVLIIVIVTRFIPLSSLSIVLAMVMWENCQCLGKNIVWSTG